MARGDQQTDSPGRAASTVSPRKGGMTSGPNCGAAAGAMQHATQCPSSVPGASYSNRSAVVGATRDARTAGIQHAARPVRPMAPSTTA